MSPRAPARRQAFESELGYSYPSHLREAVAELPNAPGVYVFHAGEGDIPLYIGKSVNLRSRVLSHLRTASEARMLRQTQRISHIRTAGEIGALLLEASMIKAQQPLLNQKLRRNRQLCAWQLEGGPPQLVYAQDLNFATTPALYGLFSSQRGAQTALRKLADDNRLCYAALGLERLAAGRACFRATLKQCAGVCCGSETAQAHQTRLLDCMTHLQVACWPFGGAVGLVERFEALVQIHVVHNWSYLGSATTAKQAAKLCTQAPGFDADGYKILCGPLLRGGAELVPIP